MTTEQLYGLFIKHPKVETDSRKIIEGCLFFALKGENFNGNKFAADALGKGAAFAIIDEEKYLLPNRTILVNNVLEALQKLANFHRRQLQVPILAITGSNGKTTTKELISAVLAKRFRLVSTSGNLNNHIGVPLTLLQMNEYTDFGVIEMGANHAGEIAALCAVADPDFGIITNIGKAHLEGFGSFETIKNTKAELYNHIKSKNGIIFYNSENPLLAELTSTIERKISYGEVDADFTGKIISSSPFMQARVNFPHGTIKIETHLIGSYNFENLMAAVCIGNYFNVEPADITSAIANYQPQNNRSQMIEKNDLKIVMDAYNANPTSMKASIESFVAVFRHPRILILGDMLELGEKTFEEHTLILEYISGFSFKSVFLVGPIFTDAAKIYPYKAFLNSEELSAFLKQNQLEEGAVLIKGSRGMQLEKVLEYL